MMNIAPKISIIVPAHNVESEIERCVHSLTSQTHRNIEIVVVDDGSSDNTTAILDGMAEEDRRIVVVHQKNGGAAQAREVGICVASGDYLMFCDADDYYEENACEALLRSLSENDADVAIGGYAKHENGEIHGIGISEDTIRLSRTEAIDCLLTGRHFSGSLCTKLYCKELFENLSVPLQVRMNEDFLLLYYVLKKTGTVVITKDVVYHYVVRSASTCGTVDWRARMRDVVAVAQNIYEDAQEEPYLSAARERYVRFLLSDYRSACAAHDQSMAKIRRQEILSCVPRINGICARGLRYSLWMLRHIPGIYRIIYRVYDKIRVPNWDV